MKFSVSLGNAENAVADGLVFFAFEGDSQKFAALDRKTGGLVSQAFKKKEFTGKKDESLFIRTSFSKILLVGLGKKAVFDANKMRNHCAGAFSGLKSMDCKTIAFECAHHESSVEFGRVCAEACVLGDYSFEKYKTPDKDDKKKTVDNISIFVPSDAAGVKKAVDEAGAVSACTNYCRELDNEPGNKATPSFLADQAKILAKTHKLKLRVLEKKELQKLGLNAFLSVSAGSSQPPKLIVLEWSPSNACDTVAVVGKGITFDSGGISLKPPNDMDKMKFDKSGACAVFGIMRAASELRLPVHVIGVIAATENMPSGSASKPGDLIKAYSGKTIEILNTDAEGRLALADAIAYVEKHYRPSAIIDLATLTGACVIALGDCASGLLSNNDELAERLKHAGDYSGERVWRLPLWDEYGEKIKSDFADLKNTGDGTSGTITAGMFLKNFVGEHTPWAHLDIAGTAWVT
ncbi:MAG: leucyl aminopeptidase, partial [Candidatus Micrarchaeota archaeon]